MTLTRRRFCRLLAAAPIVPIAPIAVPPAKPASPSATSAATLHAQATRLLVRGKLYERAARYLTEAAEKGPKNPLHLLALGCACASRAVSLTYAVTATKKLAQYRASYGDRVKEFNEAQEDQRKNYPQFYDPAAEPPRLPPTQVYATKDDDLPYRLTPAQCRSRIQDLTQKAQAAWNKGLTLSLSPEEKALAFYTKGWGLRVLRESLKDFLSPLPPEADVHKAFEQATLAAPENPLYWQAKADALSGKKATESETSAAEDTKAVDEAKVALLEAVEQKPRNAAMLWYRLYRLSATRGYKQTAENWRVAEGYLQKARASDRNNAWPLYEQAGILFRYAPYGIATGASGPRNAPESVMEPLRDAVRNEAARKNGRQAIDLIIEGNQAPNYAAPEYRESVPDLLAVGWRYFHPFDVDGDGYSRIREVARAACSYGQFLAEFENSESNAAEAERAGRASINMGWRLIGNWPVGDGPNAEQTFLRVLVGWAVTNISYKMLLKTYKILDATDKADALQTEMDAFDRISRDYKRVTNLRSQDRYLAYY